MTDNNHPTWDPDADTRACFRLDVLNPEQRRTFQAARDALGQPRAPAPTVEDMPLLQHAGSLIGRLGAWVPQRPESAPILTEARRVVGMLHDAYETAEGEGVVPV